MEKKNHKKAKLTNDKHTYSQTTYFILLAFSCIIICFTFRGSSRRHKSLYICHFPRHECRGILAFIFFFFFLSAETSNPNTSPRRICTRTDRRECSGMQSEMHQRCPSQGCPPLNFSECQIKEIAKNVLRVSRWPSSLSGRGAVS